jgi:hypothetical protein
MLLWHSSCMLQPRLVGLEPSGIIDGDGMELWLARVSLANQGGTPVRLDPDTSGIEARIDGRWVTTGEQFRLSSVVQGHTNETLFLVARNADACRLHLRFAYDGIGLEHSILDWLWRKCPVLYRTRGIGNLLGVRYYSSLSRQQHAVSWRQVMTPEFLLMESPVRDERRSHGAHAMHTDSAITSSFIPNITGAEPVMAIRSACLASGTAARRQQE